MSHLGYLRHRGEFNRRLAHEGRAQEREEAMSMFSAPSAPSGGIKWEDHKGHLLLIEPLSVEEGIATTFGTASAVKANVVVIDTDERFDDCLIFPKILQSQVRSQIGAKVLGRLGQGQAKSGQSAPWLLGEASPEDIAKGEKWVTDHAAPKVQSAAAPF